MLPINVMFPVKMPSYSYVFVPRHRKKNLQINNNVVQQALIIVYFEEVCVWEGHNLHQHLNDKTDLEHGINGLLVGQLTEVLHACKKTLDAH